MTHATITLAAALALVAGCQTPEADDAPASGAAPPATAPLEEAPGFLYGRVVTNDGDTYEGRLRWGGGEEAFWGDFFNGVKDENPWAAHTPLERQAEESRPAKAFGIELPWGEPAVDLSRPFMARFGDIARIESVGDGVRGVIEDRTAFDPDVRVTLKSGATFDLDRLAASDFDDGVRVWDGRRGIVDLGAREILVIELLPTPRLGGVPERLHGTVRTRGGDFTGFLQWDREESVGSDRLVGRDDGGERRLRFDSLRTIAWHADGVRATQLDGSEVVLTGTRKVGEGHRGVYVDDPRYGRVLVSWDAFERVDFSPGTSGPAYGDFPPGRSLRGTITTRDGRRLTGRLVYDLDEIETTETLDAPSAGVDYTIPFGRVASVVLPEADATGPASVTLHGGETLALERAGDLGEGNAGLLVFAKGREQPVYVPWADVARIDLDRSPEGGGAPEPASE